MPIQRQIAEWLEQRTGLQTAIKDFLYEDIPASSGWHQVFGSMALFAFLVQVFTGILLSFNYAPTPGEAYNSVKYIMTEVAAGHLIRGLHHWGASMMIIIVVLHMIQVFIYGAYKKPREATWMIGCVLLLITLAFGLTGYLLPWDNRGYWATVVATQIGTSAPVLGPYLARLMGGSNGIGVVTFARFYSLHVLILPPLTMLLIATHVYLVRKHGVAPLAGDNEPKKKFFPEQVFKDTFAIFIAFCILFTMAAAVSAPLERLADPTDTSYTPRPDWYFLFLFQTLKFFNGPLEFVGSMVLPGLATLALFLAPFIDRSTLKRVTQRTTAIGIVVLGGVGWATLTAAAIVTTPKQSESVPAAQGAPAAWQQLSPGELVGLAYFRKENCKACHPTAPGSKKTIGPDLADAAQRHTGPWLIEHFKHPQQMVPGSAMPPVALPDDQLSALSMFILKINLNNEKALFSTPDDIVAGALVYQENHCESCHKVNGVGMQVGPALNGLAGRHTRDWVEQHFADPQKLVPGSSMPAYKFSPADLDHITSYIMQLP
ncbi:MAG TPA: cytochrome b N-terminal domain-containing protein [Bryobacteraceae bacterium]|nr:cytochrome b N-terminal domain-containing protein [Bryobacteraceae bacterium]